MEELRVLVADGCPLYLEGIRRTLSEQTGFEVIGQATTGEAAFQYIRSHHPHVAVVSVDLPTRGAMRWVRSIARNQPIVSTILLAPYEIVGEDIHALLAGASGYCFKDIDGTQLVEAIQLVVKGKFVIKNQVFEAGELSAHLEKYRPGGVEFETLSKHHLLSPREMEILMLVSTGMANMDIGLNLGVSTKTVKNVLSSVYRKLEVQDRTQAAVYAYRHGLASIK